MLEIVGADGGPEGVSACDKADIALEPTEFCALTLNLYAVAFVNPVTVQVSLKPVHPETVVQEL
jgi:hypothetical protein